MNGPEHYAEAERLLARVNPHADDAIGLAHNANTIAEARTHAELAQVAATIESRAFRAPFAPLDHEALDHVLGRWGMLRSRLATEAQVAEGG